MDAIAACRVLSGEDVSCAGYISRFSGEVSAGHSSASHSVMTLEEAIEKGLAKDAAQITREMLVSVSPLDLVEQVLIPALDRVGEAYDRQQIFLPQLMNAASASGAAFDEVKAVISKSGIQGESKGPFLLATVEGDIHDIGKDIVRTVVENYGYTVIDLGRDVKVERVVKAAKESGAKAIGLSALMTTTVPSMQRTIAALRKEGIHVPVIVGGAVLTADYAKDIGADYYAKDAKQCADIVRALIP